MVENVKQKEAQGLSSILRSDLFSNLFPEEERAVLDRTEIMRLQKGGILFYPGEKAEHLYLLLEGYIRVFKPNEDGRDDEIACFAPGDIIGDFDFARGADYDAHAEALEDSSLVMFPRLGATMEKFALEEPNIISKILLNSANMVTDRIKETRKLIIESAYWVQELYRKAYEDSATGLWKQTFLTDEINRILEAPMALIMLKPDRFKVLVDARGHGAGDEAMIKIAAILKSVTRKLDRGWALRFKSNETGILINNCDSSLAESLADSVSSSVVGLPHVSLGKGDFSFSGTIVWSVWPMDNKSWDSLFKGTYQLLLDTWKAGGDRVVRYRKEKLP